METKNYIFVTEFKMGTATEALAQIKEKKYYEKYENRGKQIELIGVGFDDRERNIKDYIIEKLN